jgi:hypothetical protein
VHGALGHVAGEKRALRLSDFALGHEFGRTIGHAHDLPLSLGLVSAAASDACRMRGHKSTGCGSDRGCSE